MQLKELWSLLKETYQEWSEDKAPRLAAALSYYTIFSLAPLLVVVIAVSGIVWGEQAVQNRLSTQIASVVGDQAAEAIQSMIAGARIAGGGVLATILGVFTLLLGATGVFNQLHEAMNTIWEVVRVESGGIVQMLKDRLLSFTMVLGIGFLLLVSLVVDTALSAFNTFAADFIPGSEILWMLLNQLVSLAVIVLLFAMIYKILPDVKIEWSDVWVGALVTGVLFVIGKWALGFYLGSSSLESTYGAAASLVLILLWVYYSAQILFFGAEFTQVYARRYGSKLEPEEGAIRLTEEARAAQGIPHRATVEAKRRQMDFSPDAYPHPALDVNEADLMPPAQPSLLAFSTITALLVGFVGGLLARARRR